MPTAVWLGLAVLFTFLSVFAFRQGSISAERTGFYQTMWIWYWLGVLAFVAAIIFLIAAPLVWSQAGLSALTALLFWNGINAARQTNDQMWVVFFLIPEGVLLALAFGVLPSI